MWEQMKPDAPVTKTLFPFSDMMLVFVLNYQRRNSEEIIYMKLIHSDLPYECRCTK
jgi:hypothetical protein